jgi:hypothetical protein
MWLSAIKLAVSAGSKIYANKQKTKMAMSDAQLMHAEKMATGAEAYQGKLLESRQSDWKDEFILILLLFFVHFGNLPLWYQTIFVGVIASVYGLKATHLIKNK